MPALPIVGLLLLPQIDLPAVKVCQQQQQQQHLQSGLHHRSTAV